MDLCISLFSEPKKLHLRLGVYFKNTKLANTPKRCAAFQKDCNRLEWRVGREELSEIQQKQMQGSAPGEEQPQAPVQARGDLRLLMDKCVPF